MHLKSLVLVAGCAFAAAAHSQIVQYTAPGGSFAPTTVDPNATASDLNDTGSSATLEQGVTFPNSVFLSQGLVAPDAASAVANSQFFQFSVAPASGMVFNFTGLSFDAAKGGSTGPRGWVLRSSLDGFASNIATMDVPTTQPTTSPFNVSFLGAAFHEVSALTTFRIYDYAPGGAGTGIFYDNITLNGSVLAPALVRYEAQGGSFLPSFVGSHMSASDLNDTGSSADLQPGVTFPDTVFLSQGSVAPDAASAVANNQYFQFTADVEDGFEMDLSALTFDVAKGGSSAPRGWVLRSSLDGFASNIATSDVATVQPNLSSFSVDLSGSLFQDLTSDVTFRFYDYSPGGAGTGMFYDNIALRGSLSAVPEPATLAGLTLGVLALRRRRKQKTA